MKIIKVIEDCIYLHKNVGIDRCNSVQFSSVAQSRPTLCDPMACSPPGSSVRGISQQCEHRLIFPKRGWESACLSYKVGREARAG